MSLVLYSQTTELGGNKCCWCWSLSSSSSLDDNSQEIQGQCDWRGWLTKLQSRIQDSISDIFVPSWSSLWYIIPSWSSPSSLIKIMTHTIGTALLILSPGLMLDRTWLHSCNGIRTCSPFHTCNHHNHYHYDHQAHHWHLYFLYLQVQSSLRLIIVVYFLLHPE